MPGTGPPPPAPGKRKRKVPVCPNPLFVKWLTEWKNEATEKGWKSSYTYGRALSSLKKFPITLEKGADCKILTNFGPKLCSMLDKKLEEHKLNPEPEDVADEHDGPGTSSSANQNVRLPSTSQSCSRSLPDDNANLTIPKQVKAKRTSSSSSTGRKYVPAYRSGAYAILTTLYHYCVVEQRSNYMKKSDLIRLADDRCDKSMTVADTGSYYTAFSSMSTLIAKQLVLKTSGPARYQLTEEGRSLAESLVKTAQPNSLASPQSPSKNVAAAQPSTSQARPTMSSNEHSAQSLTSTTNRRLASNDSTGAEPITSMASTKGRRPRKPPAAPAVDAPSLQTELLNKIQTSTISTVPTSSSQPPPVCTSTSASHRSGALFTLHPARYEIVLIVDSREHFGFGRAKQQILPGLTKLDVKFDVRPLSVGDFLWIAREPATKREVVLDFIIERKRLDDLSGSIVDGRYKEQKMRMKQSGCRKPIYLIESYKIMANEKIKEDALLQSIANTQVNLSNRHGVTLDQRSDRESIMLTTFTTCSIFFLMLSNIIDDFYIKRCDNIIEVISYLGTMHHYIKSKYTTHKTLYGYTREDLPEIPFSMDQEELCQVIYSDFQSGAVKSKKCTVGEIWKRMLMVAPGVSVDKATVITNLYPTYASLVEKWRSKSTNSERQEVIANLKSGSTNRKLGDTLARNLLQLLFNSEPLN